MTTKNIISLHVSRVIRAAQEVGTQLLQAPVEGGSASVWRTDLGEL